MRLEIIYKNKEVFEEDTIVKLEKYMDKKIQKLEKILDNFPQDTISLHISLERNFHREEFKVSFNLSLPSETLHATEEGDNLYSPINSATENIIRQIEKFKSRLRKEHLFSKQEKVVE